jgi:putative DNA primase/helicase
MTNTPNYPYMSQLDDLNRFVEAASGRVVLAVSDRPRWLAFDGNTWTANEAETAARELALEVVTAKHDELTDEKAKGNYASQRLTLGYPEVLVRAAEKERALRRPVADFDTETHLIGCANGVLDLRTGALHTGRADLWVSRSTGITYDPSARCPRWERFLTEVLPADDEVQTYLQDLAGYLLTGETNVQKMWILHGRGANGKTVLIRTLLDLLGDYGQQAPRSVLLGSERHGGPRTDIVRLDGMRFVALTETDSSDAFSESRVKELTGGERVAARRMYAEEVEFVPQAKFLLATNNLPTVRGSDEGIWRRLTVVPFTQTFTDPDPGLVAALRAELPGILAWAVRGAQRFYANERKLPTPTEFQTASNEYRGAQDHLTGFLADACELDADAVVSADDLQKAYQAWAREEGRTPLPWQTGIAAGLRDRGFSRERLGKARHYHWRGLRLSDAGSPQLTLAALRPPSGGRTPADPGGRTTHSRPPLGRR